MPQTLAAAAPADAENALAAIRECAGRHVPQDMADQCGALIAAHLERLKFGSIAITVHDGRIVQLDVTEKRRLAR